MGTSLGPFSNPQTTTRPASATAPAFAIGIVVGAVVLGLMWATSALVNGDQEPPSPAPSSSLATRSSPSSEAAAPLEVRRTRQERCVAAAARLETTLTGVGPAMAQWQVHVGAMNKLVVGEITLQQATDFWERTRVGAQRRLASVEEAGRPIERRGLDCPTPDRLGRATTLVRVCSARVAADETSWLAARRALGTWAKHVQDMDMLRMGHLSPQAATRMWLASWQQGVREIDGYRGAVKAARRAEAC